ncbi:site-specific integrase [Pseudomonas sp. WJP1]|uniref:site-specific integrase n=1 Tax=Pseudomonas sp. WJP1 TaxID=2986947 RepID=UPI00234AA060|nr:site-specific integrase [Pseudomonas sp. WJP1]WCM53987.1 site-specific integrase [Pseudomonas sp. WJP1]
MKVFEFKSSSGNPTALIFNNDKPVFWANYWLINQHPTTRPKSLITYSYDLCLVILFFYYKKIDYIRRFSNGSFLTNGELTKLRTHLTETKSTLENRIAGIGIINPKKVSNSTYDRRCGIAKKFLEYIAEELILGTNKDKRKSLSDFRDRLKNQLRSYNSDNENIVQPWTNEDYIKMDLTIKSNSKNREKFLVHRDLVVFHLLRESGIRNSELLGIRVDGFQRTNRGYVTTKIEASTDMNLDPRTSPATVKTFNRELKISDSLWGLIERYIIERKKIKASIKHPFLIIGISGQPLSNDAVGKIFKTLSEQIELKITPHSLRHSWSCNFIFNEYEKASFVTGREKERIISNALSVLRVQMGWSLKSSMPEYYAKYAFQKIGNERLLSEDRSLHNKLSKDVSYGAQSND